jgi:hypothetical protein
MAVRTIPLATLVASVVLLSACGSGPAGDPTPASPAPSGAASAPAAPADPAFAEPAPAEAGGTIGPGTACAIPATLSTAPKWNPKDVSRHDLTVGEATLRCEIDPKPAGVVGFIWVYTYDGDDAQHALTTVLAHPSLGGKKSAEQQVTIGGKSGVEAALVAEETGPGRAFAAGGVVVVWRGFEEEDFVAGLPAYVLARTSVTF